MSISLKRARAIFVKDYKEFSRNYAVSLLLIFQLLWHWVFEVPLGFDDCNFRFNSKYFVCNLCRVLHKLA